MESKALLSRRLERAASRSRMQLVIFIGPQAAGKTTFRRRYFADAYRVVSKDLLRKSSKRQARQMTLIERALERGESIVVDNTNPRVADRAPIIRAGKRYGAAIVGFVFESGISECLRRNAQREGHARVPAVAIYTTARRLERPTAAEGFDALFRVRLRPEGFEVHPEHLPSGPLWLPAPAVSARLE